MLSTNIKPISSRARIQYMCSTRRTHVLGTVPNCFQFTGELTGRSFKPKDKGLLGIEYHLRSREELAQMEGRKESQEKLQRKENAFLRPHFQIPPGGKNLVFSELL